MKLTLQYTWQYRAQPRAWFRWYRTTAEEVLHLFELADRLLRGRAETGGAEEGLVILRFAREQHASHFGPGAAGRRRWVRMFKPQFARLVEEGAKRQTVRPVPKRLPRPGDVIDCREWEGRPYRSRQLRIVEGGITRVEHLAMIAYRRPECPDVCIEGKWLQAEELEAFARADGFANASEMGLWFHAEHGLPFEGIVICWEPVEGGRDE